MSARPKARNVASYGRMFMPIFDTFLNRTIVRAIPDHSP